MTDYKALLDTVERNIQAVPSGIRFRLRNLLSNPPAGVGRKLCQDVLSGKYPDVRVASQDKESVIYEKI